MTITHRGVVLELQDTDVRVQLIEALLFSTALPEAIRVVVDERPVGDPPPRKVQTFWARLSKPMQTELALLSKRAYEAKELERALGVGQPRLASFHSRLSRLAAECDVAIRVHKLGRVRADRRYELRGDDARWVAVLAGG